MKQMPRPARVVAVGLSLFFNTVFGLLWGALSGALVALVASTTVSAGFLALGLPVEPGQFYQIGAALGWVGGFLRTIHIPEGY